MHREEITLILALLILQTYIRIRGKSRWERTWSNARGTLVHSWATPVTRVCSRAHLKMGKQNWKWFIGLLYVLMWWDNAQCRGGIGEGAWLLSWIWGASQDLKRIHRGSQIWARSWGLHEHFLRKQRSRGHLKKDSTQRTSYANIILPPKCQWGQWWL